MALPQETSTKLAIRSKHGGQSLVPQPLVSRHGRQRPRLTGRYAQMMREHHESSRTGWVTFRSPPTSRHDNQKPTIAWQDEEDNDDPSKGPVRPTCLTVSSVTATIRLTKRVSELIDICGLWIDLTDAVKGSIQLQELLPQFSQDVFSSLSELRNAFMEVETCKWYGEGSETSTTLELDVEEVLCKVEEWRREQDHESEMQRKNREGEEEKGFRPSNLPNRSYPNARTDRVEFSDRHQGHRHSPEHGRRRADRRPTRASVNRADGRNDPRGGTHGNTLTAEQIEGRVNTIYVSIELIVALVGKMRLGKEELEQGIDVLKEQLTEIYRENAELLARKHRG